MDYDVVEAVGHPRFGRFAVASGAAGFLVIGFEALRQIEVGDKAHVGFVDAHAEGDGGDHDDAVLAQEALLMALAHVGAQAGVIGQGVDALLLQPGRRLVDLAPRQAVDDARFAAMIGEKSEQLLARIVTLDDGVADVRAIEAGDKDLRRVEPEAGDDLLPRQLVGGGGERDARDVRVALVQFRELDVLGPEVVAPLRHAVRLVDGEQRELAARVELVHQADETVGKQALGRDVHQIELAAHQAAFGVDHRVESERGIEESGAYAGLQQRVDLILHQRDQRRDDDADARPQQRRNLEAQGLAAAGWHQHQRVAAVAHMLDDLGLMAAKLRVAENAMENFVGGRGHFRAFGGGARDSAVR